MTVAVTVSSLVGTGTAPISFDAPILSVHAPTNGPWAGGTSVTVRYTTQKNDVWVDEVYASVCLEMNLCQRFVLAVVSTLA